LRLYTGSSVSNPVSVSRRLKMRIELKSVSCPQTLPSDNWPAQVDRLMLVVRQKERLREVDGRIGGYREMVILRYSGIKICV
jgi:hypothetical protein